MDYFGASRFFSFGGLTALTSLTRLAVSAVRAWPDSVQQLTGLRHLVSFEGMHRSNAEQCQMRRDASSSGCRDLKQRHPAAAFASLGAACHKPAHTRCLPLLLPAQELRDAGWSPQHWWMGGGGMAAGGQALQQALMALTGLTGLHLHSGVAAVPNPAVALQQSSQLLWLYEGGYTPVFDADAWPEQLRCARLTWRLVLQAPWAASFALCMRFLRIKAHEYGPEKIDWGSVQRQPGWAAFWSWAATAPDLRLLEVRGILAAWLH